MSLCILCTLFSSPVAISTCYYNKRSARNSHFLSELSLITSSAKQHDELQETQNTKLPHFIESSELDIGVGVNQIGTLNRPIDILDGVHI